ANIKGYNVKISSSRYEVFKISGLVCKECGLQAKFFAIEKGSKAENYHLNLYGTKKDGQEVLFTKDHIIPKSKGGKNDISNYQTMCSICNLLKSDKYDAELQEVEGGNEESIIST
ncbi:MAG: HNH endonuclease, partial [Candidatus Gastranaerophilaceae bacterium]